MSITIRSNISSLLAQRRLGDSTGDLRRSFERLSSGLRINRASDDAAGLAIADSLRADARIYEQGIKNVNDGLSMLSIAESAVQELSNIVIRIQELAEQSANGVITNTQREALDSEGQALRSEYNRIVATTEFNGRSLFSVGNSAVDIQLGKDSSEHSRITARIGEGLSRTAGDGVFGAPESILTGLANPGSMAAVDANNDGLEDIVIMDWAGVRTLLSNGDGTFSEQPASGTLTQTEALQIGDFNNDGIADAATIARTSNEHLWILLGNGDGTFSAKQSVDMHTGSGSQDSLRVSDLNNDGRSDLISLETTSSVLSVRLSTGAGTFGALTTIAVQDNLVAFALAALLTIFSITLARSFLKSRTPRSPATMSWLARSNSS